jgi:hypothetical protein
MKKLLITALAILCIAAPAEAQFGRLLPPRNANEGYKTGNDALRLCAAHDESQLLECLGFIEGVNDMLVNNRAAAHLPPCYGPGVKVDQIVLQNVFIDYLIKYPEKRPEQGAKLMTDSFVAAFCPAK